MEKKNVLVTGGAGYIGSHAVKRLAQAGYSPVVLDNLGRGHRAAVPEGVAFVELDLRRTDEVRACLLEHEIECVMHFAAYAYVGESVKKPLMYYENNVGGSVSLLAAMDSAGVRSMVFSSTCATYGEPAQMPITEEAPQNPVNPYGASKLLIERMLRDYAATRDDFGFASLRYFNVAGCASDGTLGEDHDPETHLIPSILLAALELREGIVIFGDDYPTPDGTCIRDYTYVEDLVDAHIRVMDALDAGSGLFYNLGIGTPCSVREVIDAARDVTGREFTVEVGPRRPGDPPELYSDPGRIARELGWRAKVTDIREIIETAWRWFSKHPNGYRDA